MPYGGLGLLGNGRAPMLPHRGQGANQTIEDGMALATILARATPGRLPLASPALRRTSLAQGGQTWTSAPRFRAIRTTAPSRDSVVGKIPRRSTMPAKLSYSARRSEEH